MGEEGSTNSNGMEVHLHLKKFAKLLPPLGHHSPLQTNTQGRGTGWEVVMMSRQGPLLLPSEGTDVSFGEGEVVADSVVSCKRQ